MPAGEMQIAILVFDGITALDAVGPYEVLSRIPGAETRFAARQPGPKRTHESSSAWARCRRSSR